MVLPRAGFTYSLSRLKPRASEKMGGLGGNEGPHHEQRRPFFFSSNRCDQITLGLSLSKFGYGIPHTGGN